MKKIKEITRRLKRWVSREREPDASELVQGMIGFLASSSENVGSFLEIARTCGRAALDNMRGPAFHGGFLRNVYQLGEDHDLAYVVLPGAKILDRSFNQETVVIHLPLEEDVFFVMMLLDEQNGVMCRTGWKKASSNQEWPATVQALNGLHQKIVAVMPVLADLLALHAAN